MICFYLCSYANFSLKYTKFKSIIQFTVKISMISSQLQPSNPLQSLQEFKTAGSNALRIVKFLPRPIPDKFISTGQASKAQRCSEKENGAQTREQMIDKACRDSDGYVDKQKTLSSDITEDLKCDKQQSDRLQEQSKEQIRKQFKQEIQSQSHSQNQSLKLPNNQNNVSPTHAQSFPAEDQEPPAGDMLMGPHSQATGYECKNSSQKLIEMSSLSESIEDLFKKISALTQSANESIGFPQRSCSFEDTAAHQFQSLSYNLIHIDESITHSQSMDNSNQHRSSEANDSTRQNIGSQTNLGEREQPASSDLHVTTQIYNQQQLSEGTSYDYELSMSSFEVGKILGHGKFGEVVVCRHKKTRLLYALKKILKSTVEQYNMQSQILTEIQACCLIDHPNLMKSYTAFSDEFHIFVLCEHLMGEQLTKKVGCDQITASQIIAQVLSGLKFLHSVGIVHRDLKPQNIRIDDNEMIKICDFGWAAQVSTAQEVDQQTMQEICGTLDYVCPEMALHQPYTKQVDLWSVGVLTYELVFGKAPFSASNSKAVFQRVRNLDFSYPAWADPASECQDFINRLLKPENQRMRLDECIEHPFILKYSSECKCVVQEHTVNDIICS